MSDLINPDFKNNQDFFSSEINVQSSSSLKITEHELEFDAPSSPADIQASKEPINKGPLSIKLAETQKTNRETQSQYLQMQDAYTKIHPDKQDYRVQEISTGKPPFAKKTKNFLIEKKQCLKKSIEGKT